MRRFGLGLLLWLGLAGCAHTAAEPEDLRFEPLVEAVGAELVSAFGPEYLAEITDVGREEDGAWVVDCRLEVGDVGLPEVLTHILLTPAATAVQVRIEPRTGSLYGLAVRVRKLRMVLLLVPLVYRDEDMERLLIDRVLARLAPEPVGEPGAATPGGEEPEPPVGPIPIPAVEEPAGPVVPETPVDSGAGPAPIDRVVD